MASVIEIDMERSCCWSMMVFKMSYTSKRGSNGASKRLAIRGVGKLLSLEAILLRSECERYVRGR